MLYPRNKCLIICVLIFMLTASFQCAGTANKATEITDEQKEEDLITLLNARQVKPPDMMTDAEKKKTEQELESLRSNFKLSQDEANTLKSELLMKEEKIRQLEEQLAASKTGELPVKEQQVKTADTVVPVMSGNYTADYQKAYDEFMAYRYENSLAMFQDLLERDSKHALSDNCQYWIGECFFALKDYKKAIIEFEKVFTYLNSNKDDDAQIKLGICYYQLGDMARAKTEFTKLINNYPKSEYGERAKSMLAKIG
ncbi:tetratricopeptide repeat protein [candidate division KSB1 bacterium]